jgi:hypothetical protein
MQALLATIGLVRPKAKLAPTIIDIFTATINLHLPRSVHGIPHEPGRNKDGKRFLDRSQSQVRGADGLPAFHPTKRCLKV